MKQIFVIAIAVLVLPFTAFSMTLMTDSELDSIMGQAGGSAEIPELNTDQQRDDVDQDSMDFQTYEPIVVELNTDRAADNSFRSWSNSHGVSILLVDFQCDIYIHNIAWGDPDRSSNRRRRR